MGQKAKKIRKYISLGGIFLLLGNFLAPFVPLGSLGGVPKARADFSKTSAFSLAMQSFYSSNTTSQSVINDINKYTSGPSVKFLSQGAYNAIPKGRCNISAVGGFALKANVLTSTMYLTGYTFTLYDSIYYNVDNVNSSWKNYLNDLATIYDPNSSLQTASDAVKASTADAVKVKENAYLVYYGLNRWTDECVNASTGVSNIDLDSSNNKQIGAPSSWPAAVTPGSSFNYDAKYKSMEDWWDVFSSIDGQVQLLRDAEANSNGQLPTGYDMAGWRAQLIQIALNPANANQSTATSTSHDACGTTGYGWQAVRQTEHLLCAFVVILTDLTNNLLYTSALALNENAGPMIPNVVSSSNIQGNGIINLDGSSMTAIIDLGYLIGTSVPVEAQLINRGTSGFGSLVVGAYNAILGAVDFLLLVIFLLVALANILQIEMNSYSLKKILPGIIIGFICAQFSMFGIRSLLEVTSALTKGVIGAVVGTSSGANAGQQFIGAFEGFPFGNNTIYGCGKPDAEAVRDPNLSVFTDNCAPGNDVSFMKLVKQGISNIFVLVGAIFLFILAFYFILRQFIFYALVPLAPLAFLGLFFPPLKIVWSRWWKFLSGWLFMPLAAGFWLAMAVLWFKATSGTDGVASLLGYTFGIVALYLAIKTPFSMAGEAGVLLNKMNTIGGKPFKAAGKFVGDEAKRSVSLSKVGEMGRTVQGWRDNRKADLDAAKAGVDLRKARKAAGAETQLEETRKKQEAALKREKDLSAIELRNPIETAELAQVRTDLTNYTKDINSLDKTFKKFSSDNEKRAQNQLVREQNKAAFAGGNDYVKSHAQANLSDPDATNSRLAREYRRGDVFLKSQSDTNKRNMARADSNGKTYFASAEDIMSEKDKIRLDWLEKHDSSAAEQAEMGQLYNRRNQAEVVAAARSSKSSSTKIFGAVSEKVLSKQEASGTRAFLRDEYGTKIGSPKQVDQVEANRHAQSFNAAVRDDIVMYDAESISGFQSAAMANKITKGASLPALSNEESANAQQDLSAVLAIFKALKMSPNNVSQFKRVGATIAKLFSGINPFDGVTNATDVNRALSAFTNDLRYKELQTISENPAKYFAS